MLLGMADLSMQDKLSCLAILLHANVVVCHLLNTGEDLRTQSVLLSVHVGTTLNLLSLPPSDILD